MIRKTEHRGNSSKKIFEEIKKRYPEHLKIYKKERLHELYEEIKKHFESELLGLIDLWESDF